MCFVSLIPPTKHIADKDIKVYKVVRKFEDKYGNIYYRSQIFDFKYKIGKTYKMPREFLWLIGKRKEPTPRYVYHEYASLLEHHTIDGYEIDEGYHSYINTRFLDDELRQDSDLSIISCIIPKGSVYYIESDKYDYDYNDYIENAHIVSNQIKIIEEYEQDNL